MAFKKGESGNANGRPRGAANKVTRELKEMILGALDEAGGQDYLQKQATENPNAFMTLIGKVLPSTINAQVTTLAGAEVKYVANIPSRKPRE